MKPIRLPNGDIVNFPDSMSDEDIAKVLQREVPGKDTRPTAGSFIDKAVSVVESLKEGLSPRSGAGGAVVQAVGRGLAELGMPWLETTTMAYNKARDADIAGLREKAGFTGMDLPRAVGQVVNPSNVAMLPAAPAATWGGRALQGAKLAGAQSLLSPVQDPTRGDFLEQKGTNALASAALGFAATPATELAGRGVGAAFSAARNAFAKPPTGVNVDQWLSMQLRPHGVTFADLSADMQQALRSQAADALSGGNAAINPEMVRRAQDFAAAGLSPTKGQITRDPVQWSWEMNKRGVVDDLTQRFNEQSSQLTSKLQQLQASSGPAMQSFDAGKVLIESLRKADSSMSSRVTSAYAKAREATGATLPVDMTPIARQLGEAIELVGQDNIPSQVRRTLESYGLLAGKQTKVFDLLEADKLLKVINANYDATKPVERFALGRIRAGLNESIDLLQAPEGQGAAALFKEAVGLAKQRFQLIDKTEGLRAAIRESTNPEDFVRKYVASGSVADLESMMKILPADAAQIVQRQLIDRIARRAVNSETDQALQRVSHAGLKNALQSITPDRLQRALTPRQMRDLQLLERVSGYQQVPPAGNYVNNSNTAVEGLRSAAGLLGKIPGAPVILRGVEAAIDVGKTRSALNPGAQSYVEPLSPELRGLLAKQLGLAGGLLSSEVFAQ